MRSGIWYVTTSRVGFWTWIWSMRHCGLGQENTCWFQCYKKSTYFIWLIWQHPAKETRQKQSMGEFKKGVCNIRGLYEIGSLRTLGQLSSRTTWLCIRISLLPLKLKIWDLLQGRSSLTFRHTLECGFTLKFICDIIITYSQLICIYWDFNQVLTD